MTVLTYSRRGAAACLALLMFFSCNKVCSPETITPFNTLLTEKKHHSSESIIEGSGAEYGNQFMSAEPGKITALGARLPFEARVQISIWDPATEKRLAAAEVEARPGEFRYTRISPLRIEKGKKYVVSVNTVPVSGKGDGYYNARNQGNNLYPLSAGPITLENQLRANPGMFPVGAGSQANSNLAGYPDFRFEY